MIWPTLNAYLTRKTDDAVAADDDDGLMHLSYADDYLALLNACVIDCLVIKCRSKKVSMSENYEHFSLISQEPLWNWASVNHHTKQKQYSEFNVFSITYL